jgi:hypothetical protein
MYLVTLEIFGCEFFMNLNIVLDFFIFLLPDFLTKVHMTFFLKSSFLEVIQCHNLFATKTAVYFRSISFEISIVHALSIMTCSCFQLDHLVHNFMFIWDSKLMFNAHLSEFFGKNPFCEL